MTKIRQYFYLVSGAIAGLLPLLVALGGVNGSQASSLTEILTNLGSLIGAGGAVTAGVIVAKQRNNGTLDAPAVSPLDQVLNNIPVVVQNATNAVAELDRLKQIAGDTLGTIPVFGSEAQELINSIQLPYIR